MSFLAEMTRAMMPMINVQNMNNASYETIFITSSFVIEETNSLLF